MPTKTAPATVYRSYRDISTITGIKVNTLRQMVFKGTMPAPTRRTGYNFAEWSSAVIDPWIAARTADVAADEPA